MQSFQLLYYQVSSTKKDKSFKASKKKHGLRGQDTRHLTNYGAFDNLQPEHLHLRSPIDLCARYKLYYLLTYLGHEGTWVRAE